MKKRKVKNSPIKDVPKFDRRFDSINTYIQECDPNTEWKKLKIWIKKQPKDLQEALDMLNELPEYLIKSTRLYLLAKREFEKFEIEWKDKTEILRSVAREYWEKEKENGMKKQITNDMIEDWIISEYGDTYKDMKMKLRDMKNVRDLLEKLTIQIENREPSLRRTIEKLDKRKNPAWSTPKMARKEKEK